MTASFDFEADVAKTPLTKSLYDQAIRAEAEQLGAMADKCYVDSVFYDGQTLAFKRALIDAMIYGDLIPVSAGQTYTYISGLEDHITVKATERGREPVGACSK